MQVSPRNVACTFLAYPLQHCFPSGEMHTPGVPQKITSDSKKKTSKVKKWQNFN